MARIKYCYNKETCGFEKVRVSKWQIVSRGISFFGLSLVLAFPLFYLLNQHIESPQEALLRKENTELESEYLSFQQSIKQIQYELTALRDQDEVYRLSTNMRPLSPTQWLAGTGGVDHYKELREENPSIADMFQQMDQLKGQFAVQEKSYEKIIDRTKRRARRFAAMPVIQPINVRELKKWNDGFGWRRDPFTGCRKKTELHQGQDLTARRGTPIYAAGDGKVVETFTSGARGRGVKISHGYGCNTRYIHMQKYVVKKGQSVLRGQLIGFVGCSGRATGCHLHYDVYRNKKRVDPMNYMLRTSASDYDAILAKNKKINARHRRRR